LSLILEAIIQEAMKSVDTGVFIIRGQRVTNMRFADNIDLVAESQDQLQELRDRVNKSSKRFGLKINAQKKQKNDCRANMTMRLENEELRRILSAEMAWLRRSLCVTRRDRIRKDTVRSMLQQEESLVQKIRKQRLTWFGHVTRMEERLPL